MAVEPKDLIREVAILVDRSDISEEIVRLRAHLTQYHATIGEAESSGGESWSSSPGNGTRDQHNWLESWRRADQSGGGRGEGAFGKDSRAGSKCRVKETIGENLPGRS